ncbi:DNA mismatch repair protein MutS [Oribacterium sp. C9]|uniref:DNA mismatch repair protein MutS n=1 Tax=Oribacterium sp. C9 TaxID=1943579 RepID=UPI00098ED9F2|nr:DNA mismatch repair protein MutS [Oribacterium sp. C9]OON86025.1 DNA mismatch repair protein MutS [Oribacterium sp. C9]
MAEKKLSPMMAEYLETKKQYPDCILFYRIGDFYEMFFEDAKTASSVLDLVLTGKDCGMEERAPMCGIPFHAAEGYVARLASNGYKVAIAEQLEDPKLSKGLVKRGVIRVITPGTLTSEQALDESKNNFLMSIFYDSTGFGISSVDITTGEFLATTCFNEKEVMDELSRFSPAEIVCNQAFMISGIDTDDVKNRFNLIITELNDEVYDDEKASALLQEHFHASLSGIGLQDKDLARLSAAAALRYVYDTQMNTVAHIANIRYYSSSQYMIIDTATQRNLELTETMREKKKRGSLLWVLDKTKTAMGARMLRRFIEQPLIDRDEILARQDAVEDFCAHFIDREEISEYLNTIYDYERLLGRICYKSANPRDLIAFKQSLKMLPDIIQELSQFDSKLVKEIHDGIDPMTDLYKLIDDAIEEDPPISSRDGGVIKSGYHEEVDRYKDSKISGKQWLADLEAEEREKTGIKSLKIKYNRIFGYCFEVTNTFKDMVPDYFIRKQTLAGSERYTTDRLEELQNTILGAEEKLNQLEYELFCDVRDTIGGNIQRIQKTSHYVALIDCIISLSKVATENNYCRPKINEEGIIDIKDGRHPVIEKLIRDGMFVSNNTYLNDASDRIAIITGPNMAGKSTYMRQTALIVLMASIGSFVPAGSAEISICDRIFTRVGASDDLASGQSTFMVEMNEVANILRNATTKSLLILDEIGRGTSTFDGLSIAWAVVEYIAKVVKAKTLFATHYHELTELEGKLEGVNNYCIAVTNHDQDIVFLRKIIPGGADQSYGIDVASLAGVPKPVIDRAKVIAGELSDADIIAKAKTIEAGEGFTQEAFDEEGFLADREKKQDADAGSSGNKSAGAVSDSASVSPELEEAMQYLRSLDVDHMTPLDAMNTLYELKSKFGV